MADRDHNAPYLQDDLPPLTELEDREMQISELKHKMSFMIKKAHIAHILESYSVSNPRYAIIKLKKLLEL